MSESALDDINTRHAINVLAEQIKAYLATGSFNFSVPEEIASKIQEVANQYLADCKSLNRLPLPRHDVYVESVVTPTFSRLLRGRQQCVIHLGWSDGSIKERKFRGSWRRCKPKVKNWLADNRKLMFVNFNVNPVVSLPGVTIASHDENEFFSGISNAGI